MKRYCLLFLTAFAAFIACHKEPVQVPQDEFGQEVREVSIEAGIHSKTVLDNENQVMWEGGDKIALLFTHPDKASYVNRTFVNDKQEASYRTVFKGKLHNSVSVKNGYDDLGYAVYPSSALTDQGVFVHNLPAEQVAAASGSFASESHLATACLSLSEMTTSSSVKTDFRAALSLLKVALTPDVESVTLTGTAPLAGRAPLKMYYNLDDAKDENNGRLLVDTQASWSESSNTVTLTPADGLAFENKTYSILVWPGKQEGLTVTLKFKNLGEYAKETSVSSQSPVIFKPAKYYNLSVSNSEELVITELDGVIDDLEQDLPSLDELEANVNALLSQIQSMTLMTEYLNNAVYAPYGLFSSGIQKKDVALDYIIKPESAAQELVKAFKVNPSVVSAVLGYKNANKFELADHELAINDLVVSDAPFGKYLTAYVNASGISKDFYEGKCGASIALQIASKTTSLLGEFANLVPKSGSAFNGSFIKDIPVIPGTKVVIPFSFAIPEADNGSYTLKVTHEENVEWASVNYNKDFKTGNLSVQLNPNKSVESQKVTITLTTGSGNNTEVVSQEFTFVDSGSKFEFMDPGQVDYIGGEITLGVNALNIKDYMLSCSGAGVSQSGNIFTFSENTGGQRTVTVESQVTIAGVSLNFYKSITLTQKAAGTSLSKTYYSNGQKVVLNQANASGCSNYFNIVIFGDGYQKKDLAVGGKFERSARAAMDSFFSVEPYKSFKNRFNVYMVAYESADEGTDIKSSGITKDTYFNTYCQGGGNTAAYVADTAPVITAVKAAAGSSDAQYYRSIAIILINTAEQSGSTGYPFRDYKSGFVNGYASFAIAVLAANSTGTNGLIKHEAGGHAFGRLADEYYTNGTTADDANKTDLSNWHAKGWYWNVSSDNTGNYYKFTNSAYGAEEVSFINGAWGYQYGMYRPTQGGMMQNNNGVFNAPSRHAIYHRIITESQGATAYSWSDFLEYDKVNR